MKTIEISAKTWRRMKRWKGTQVMEYGLRYDGWRVTIALTDSLYTRLVKQTNGDPQGLDEFFNQLLDQIEARQIPAAND